MRLLCALGWVAVAGCAARPLANPLPPSVAAVAFGVDLHLHVSMSQAAKPFFKGEPGNGTLSWNSGSRLVNQIDEAQMHASGVKLALGAVWPPFELRPGRTSLDEAVNQLEQLRVFSLRRPGFALVHSTAQAKGEIALGRIAILPAVEGGEGIREVDDVDRLWLAGARAITLVHFGANGLGGAARGQMLRNLLGMKTGGLEPLGLTALGRAAVERMIDLGVVIDLSHASDALATDVLDLAEARGVPVLNSHSGTRELSSMERNISDAIAARIAKGGGLVGVTIFERMLDEVPQTERWPGFVPDSCDEIVAHWLHLAKAAGASSLTLGSDFNGFITRHGAGGSCPHGLRNIGDLGQLWAALEAHGLPRAALDGMGERFWALLQKVESKASPSARAAARRHIRLDADLFAAP